MPDTRESPESSLAKGKFTRFMPILLIVAGAALFFAMGWHRYLSFEVIAENREALLAWADANWFLALATYAAVYALVTALSLPGAVWMTLGGAFIFGWQVAGLVVVFAATVGATAIFLAARTAFADLARAKAGSFLYKLEDGFQENAFNYLLFLRLVPLFPFWLVNLVPALLDVRLSTFVVATFIGIIPGTFVFASVGAGLGSVFEAGATPDLGIIFQPNVLLPMAALGGLALVPVIYNRWKKANDAKRTE
ncbi:MAG: TVP38/TMEM64 family protein [Rhodospirillaceae bacterium]|nr:TVP38/TMEM64 family protein [Rhodospirillaceae bacterium]